MPEPCSRPKALEGIRVLDLSRVVAAPLAAQTLADLGADVIKIERPRRGDDSRAVGLPLLKDPDGNEIEGLSSYFLAFNRNKRSVTADLTHPEGQAIVRALAKDAQVLIENYKVGDLDRFGLDFKSLHKVNPELIYCSLTGYGHTGPMADQPGLDSAFQARSGMMSVVGDPDGDPQRTALHVVDYITGQNATIAILAALRHAEQGGGGQHLDISLLDSGLAAMSTIAQRYLMSGEVVGRAGNRIPGSVVARLFDCADGKISVSAPRDDAFRRLVTVLGMTELADDPRFSNRPGRRQNEEQLDQLLEPIFTRETVAHWLEELEQAKVICAPIYSVDEAFADRQAVARGAVVQIEHAQAGEIRLLASPIRMSETPVDTYNAPPFIGQHNEEVLGGLLGYSPEKIQALKDKGVI